MSWIIIIEVIIALFCGGWVAYRLSDAIRGLVVRSMPIEKRISEESYYLQTRTSTIIGSIVALSVAAAIIWGAEEAKDYFSDHATTTQQMTLLPAKMPPEVENTATSPTTETTNDTEERPELTKEPPVHQPAASPATNKDKKGNYYLQLGAFNDPEGASELTDKFRLLLPIAIHSITIPYTIGPNKVLAGPFRSRQLAADFRSRHQLKDAFIRKYP